MFNFGLINVPLLVFVPGPQPPASLLEAGDVGSLTNKDLLQLTFLNA